MYILGLTGPVASGKSTVAQMLARKGSAVINADQLVHQLQAPGTPQTLLVADILGVHVLDDDGRLNRATLSRHIAKDPGVLGMLEGIFHPAVRSLSKAYLYEAATQGRPLAVLDVPLLFETGLNLLCDSTALCVTDPTTRRTRAFERPSMTEVQWQTFHRRRLPETEAMTLATHHINTTDAPARTQAVVESLYDHLTTLPCKAWPDAWASVSDLTPDNACVGDDFGTLSI